MKKILIIDYKMGNLRSVANKFRRMEIDCIVSSNYEDIESAEKLILPGVGHFKYGMENLQNLGLIDILNKKVIDEKTPILGICLGAQLFCKHSEEGNCKGLEWIDAEVVKFKVSDTLKYKVPHMGWNDVKVIQTNSLEKVINKDDKFYFVHSYHLKCNNPSDIWMTSEFDYEFVSAVHRDNIYGTQFHPEKSHDVGYELLKKFAEL
jgi:imidazole glycerol-phosphate synthase subunit HisH